MHCVCPCRVKLPKTFLAVNLSDAFTFQEKPQTGEEEGETKPASEQQEDVSPGDPLEPAAPAPTADDAVAAPVAVPAADDAVTALVA